MPSNFRRCVVCRKLAPKQAFWRVVRDFSSHQVQLDIGMGRSAYLCPTTDCLQIAQRKDRLGRALKAKVPESIYGALWERLAPDSGSDLAQKTSG
ncbi:MAG: YlxR family protein [Oscillatoriales cyanobacterium RM2_1_1]|nr:YlxR family protein [Oscillatoriales cyanobacterium SM2_3_0]NJO46724.1 YlxR family protein [Oscillatoriales cyanobacterium RM2_1_1]